MRPPLPSGGQADGVSADAEAESRAWWQIAAEGIAADDGVNEIPSAGTRAPARSRSTGDPMPR